MVPARVSWSTRDSPRPSVAAFGRPPLHEPVYWPGLRHAFARLARACRHAGLPVVDAVSLPGPTHWLRTRGLSHHEVAAVLGLTRVRSGDRLLRHHAALNAQPAVREVSVR